MAEKVLGQPKTEGQRKGFRLPGSPKLYIAGGLVALALGYLFFTTFQAATVFYYTIDELKAQGNTVYGKQVRVNGKVLPGSIEKEGDKLLVRFQLTEGSQTLPVVFKGIPPELFYQPYADVVAEGRYNSDGVFVANNLITRCASKYLPEA